MSCYLQQYTFPLYLYLIFLFVTCRPIQILSFHSTHPIPYTKFQQRHIIKSKVPRMMSLIPIQVDSLESCLVLGVPTAEQYGAYWGRTSKEKYSAIFESATVTFLGLFMSYFISFVIGTPLATLTGTIAAFWVLFGPELKAYQRNLDLRAGRGLVDQWIRPKGGGGGLYGAYLFSCVSNVAVVEDTYSTSNEEYPLSDFQDYTMEKDDEESIYGVPWKLRLCVEDSSGRSLQIHARMSEEYLDIEIGMPVATVLLSLGKDFTKLDALTDFYIPDANCWVGDYPYLNKIEFVRQLNSRVLQRALEDERQIDDDVFDDTSDEEEEFSYSRTKFNRKEGEFV